MNEGTHRRNARICGIGIGRYEIASGDRGAIRVCVARIEGFYVADAIWHVCVGTTGQRYISVSLVQLDRKPGGETCDALHLPALRQALGCVGERAVEGSANLEAIAHLTRGLEILGTLPEGPQRDEKELGLRVASLTPLFATNFGSADSERAAPVGAGAK